MDFWVEMWLELLLDLLPCVALFGVAAGLFIWQKKLGEIGEEMGRLRCMDKVSLHIEMMRCVNAINVCAEKGNVKACRHARRHLRRTSKVLIRREAEDRRKAEKRRAAAIVADSALPRFERRRKLDYMYLEPRKERIA